MKKSLAVTVWLFNATFYVFVFVAVIAMAIDVSRLIRTEYESTYSFGLINPLELKSFDTQEFDLAPAGKHIQDPVVVTDNWRISFNAKDLKVKFYMTAIRLMQVLYVLVILVTLRSFVMSLKKTEVFTLQNIKRLQILGVLLLLIEPLSWIVHFLHKQWLINNLKIQFSDISVAYSIGYSLAAREFVWSWIMAGLLVLTIAEVFKQGLQLKEEVDLTV